MNKKLELAIDITLGLCTVAGTMLLAKIIFEALFYIPK